MNQPICHPPLPPLSLSFPPPVYLFATLSYSIISHVNHSLHLFSSCCQHSLASNIHLHFFFPHKWDYQCLLETMIYVRSEFQITRVQVAKFGRNKCGGKRFTGFLYGFIQAAIHLVLKAVLFLQEYSLDITRHTPLTHTLISEPKLENTHPCVGRTCKHRKVQRHMNRNIKQYFEVRGWLHSLVTKQWSWQLRSWPADSAGCGKHKK